MRLSIVLITKNQEWNVDRLVQSVQENSTFVSSVEIVLVDSASTDKTITRAIKYDIDVVRLSDELPLTPAAGRFIGYKYTTGDYVLFLDGDMELNQGWLERALTLMDSDPSLGGITGKRLDLPTSSTAADKPIMLPFTSDETVEIPYGGGAAMYRRSVLNQVGQFNPYLHSDEEPDLCMRIRHAGYRIIQIQYLMVFHYTDPSYSMSTMWHRWQRKLYLGFGQNLRYKWGKKIFWLYVKERGYVFAFGVGLLCGVITLSWSMITGQKRWFGLWLALVILVIVGDTYRKFSFYRTIASLLHRTLILVGTIRGLTLPRTDPAFYPMDYDVVKSVRSA